MKSFDNTYFECILARALRELVFDSVFENANRPGPARPAPPGWWRAESGVNDSKSGAPEARNGANGSTSAAQEATSGANSSTSAVPEAESGVNSGTSVAPKARHGVNANTSAAKEARRAAQMPTVVEIAA